jgi:hypothetical protein
MTKRKESKRNDMALAEDFLQHELMNETKDYLDRGRLFEQLSIAELNAKWITAFRRFVSDDSSVIPEMNGLAAELRLRSLEPPFDAVQSEISKMTETVRRLGPGSLSDSARDRIDAFLVQRKKASN